MFPNFLEISENTRRGGVNRCMANLMTNDAELKTNCNTPSVTKECNRIPSEGLCINSSKFLQIRVEVLYEAILVQHKYWHTQTIPSMCYEKYESMQDIKEREFRDSGSIANTKICLLYTSPSPRDRQKSRMPSSA